ncbi:hypothetical protein PQO03_11755 [Lentisphaera profundi]|uniref:VOC domain-containing protein n=1 Tax=Lentisphaera profundi TaxID=1658616 RepID=A0ABY7W0F8_9BACT|nr:hypothetical protein [Lentisphaera profundi]WDE98516.1 hypothetical protein PQO03_11755 [Lentisphaera profundi]
MIHHISIPTLKPKETALVLQKIFKGKITDFSPTPNAYMLWFGDDFGSALEIYPADTSLRPGNATEACHFQIQETPHYTAVHAAISCDLSTQEILSIAKEQNWHAAEFRRGSFRVVEFWIDNHFMLELLTPEMAQEYLQMTYKHRDK